MLKQLDPCMPIKSELWVVFLKDYIQHFLPYTKINSKKKIKKNKKLTQNVKSKTIKLLDESKIKPLWPLVRLQYFLDTTPKIQCVYIYIYMYIYKSIYTCVFFKPWFFSATCKILQL